MRIFVKSFGCSTNLADGAVLAGCLAHAGYELAGAVSDADLVVYNTCAVKGPTEDRMIEILKRVSASKKLIVAGCLPLINPERVHNEIRFDGVIGPAAGERIVKVVKHVSNGERVISIEKELKSKPSLALPRLQLNPVITIVPISYGCLGSCAYCCVFLARGKLRSYSPEEITQRVKHDVGNGLREFWLTSQDAGSYGRDIGTDLAELLNTVCEIEGEFKIRVGMMTPNTVMDGVADLVRAFESRKVFKFIHLPLQSGDDDVLQHMRRFYSVNDFKRVVNRFKTKFPDIALATDVICGFPGESEEAFEQTLRVIEETRPDVVNVSKFFARPKTAAALMQRDFVSRSEIKRRSTLASALARKVALERNRQWVGRRELVLFDEIGKIKKSWVGRNQSYKPVAVKSNNNLLGKTLCVKILKAFPTYLEGQTVE